MANFKKTTTTEEPSWLELLGCNNWDGLLDPLDVTLRHIILRCGDFCQATYDSFNNDAGSKYSGSSRYGKKSFFNKVMLQSASDYQVVCFLYATAEVGISAALFLRSPSNESWDRESNFMGYIATTTDEVSRALGRREIYVAWRGTIRSYEWVADLTPFSESAKQLLRDGNDKNPPKVMNGWLNIYVSSDPNSPFTKLSARTQLQNKIKELINQYKDEILSITITGHSLGGSLAVLSAFDLVENGVKDIPVTTIVFGCPQVGNGEFKKRVDQFPNLKVLSIINKNDLIPRYPGLLMGYVDTGIKLEVDYEKSPCLKDSVNPGDWHNLQAMLHVLAGWNGPHKEFELKVKRSLALVNKSCEYLKDEYGVPGSWWVEKNKGMVVDENGEWILAPPSEEDQPALEF